MLERVGLWPGSPIRRNLAVSAYVRIGRDLGLPRLAAVCGRRTLARLNRSNIPASAARSAEIGQFWTTGATWATTRRITKGRHNG